MFNRKKHWIAGAGTTVTFYPSTFVAEIVRESAISFSGPTRESHDTTTYDTPMTQDGVVWETREPGVLVSPGTVEFQVLYDRSSPPPFRGQNEHVVIELPLRQGETNRHKVEFDGAVTSMPSQLPFTGQHTATITIQISGPIVESAGN